MWLVGLIVFAEAIPRSPVAIEASPEGGSADAIVVLTGGSGRLDAGVHLLNEGWARKLFVSGVARGVEVAALMRLAREKPENVSCCIILGYDADNTRGNARETAAWTVANGYRRVVLVTANYHMARSLVEFEAAMPGVEIIPFPVIPETVKISEWWSWPGTAVLILSEYNKYLLSLTFLVWSRLVDGLGLGSGGWESPAS